MYALTHDGEKVGSTKLESGDPTIRSASGVFSNIGGAKALAGWIKSIGGQEDDGVVFIVLNDDFILSDQDGNIVKFEEGNLIAVPADDEVFLDISGLSQEDYNTHFSEHITAMDNDK